MSIDIELTCSKCGKYFIWETTMTLGGEAPDVCEKCMMEEK